MINSNKLIINSEKQNLLNELQKSLKECKRFYFSVAFVNFSGIQLLLDTFKELEKKGVQGQIITSTYLNFTDPKALEKIRTFNNIDLTKSWINEKCINLRNKARFYILDEKDMIKLDEGFIRPNTRGAIYLTLPEILNKNN